VESGAERGSTVVLAERVSDLCKEDLAGEHMDSGGGGGNK